MAAVANSTHQKRTRPRGLVPVDISRHHRPETTHRNGRQQRWSLQIRQARQISYQIEIGPSFSIQFPCPGFERHNCTDYNYYQTIAFGSCKSVLLQENPIKIKIFVFSHFYLLYHFINVEIIFLFIFKICISISLYGTLPWYFTKV